MPGRRRPIVTSAIVLVCLAAFVWELWLGAVGGDAALAGLLRTFGLVPARLSGALAAGDLGPGTLIPLVSHQFLHGGWLHLAGNLLYLWIFGNNVEDRLGRVPFGLYFIGGGVAAAVFQVAIDPASDLPLIGASGAISAVLGAYLVLFPRAKVLSLVFLGFFYQLMEVPAVVLLGFWFLLQLFEGLLALGPASPAQGGVAVFAHIGGFVVGVASGLLVRRLAPDRSR